MYYIILKVSHVENGKVVTYSDLHKKEYPNLTKAMEGLDEIEAELDNYTINRYPHKIVASPLDDNTRKYFPSLSAEIVHTI